MNNFVMFLIKICQLRIEIVCWVKWGKIFLKNFLLFECKNSSRSRISLGGGADLMGGRQLPRWLRFKKFVCQNERIWTRRGGGTHWQHPPGSATEKGAIWASEYNLGPQKWGLGARAPGPPLDPLLVQYNLEQIKCITTSFVERPTVTSSFSIFENLLTISSPSML